MITPADSLRKKLNLFVYKFPNPYTIKNIKPFCLAVFSS